MYTCCPICKTNFNITEAQLQVAQGKVRCGSCKNVFNARQHIHYHSIKDAQSSKVETTKPTAIKTPSSRSQQTSAAIHKAVIKPSPASVDKARDLFLRKKTIEDQDTAITPKPVSEKPVSEIDAIFNALDSQLSSGTYIDIAKSEKKDIREAEFNDIFDGDEFNDADSNALTKKQNDLSINSTIEKTDNNPDLDLYTEDDQELNDIINSTLASEEINITPPDSEDLIEQASTDEVLQNTLESIIEKKEKKQQHAFDFISLPDEPQLTTEAKEELSSVNTPLKMSPTNKLVTKTENDALHQAIDNIIKVDNKITTPFEENDDDHFVIEMNSEPDVELVDENDIDRLFASTDSLKISDLKFGTSKAIDPNTATNIADEKKFQPIFSDSMNADEQINENDSDIVLSYDLDSDLSFGNELNNDDKTHTMDEDDALANEPADESLTDDEYNEADFDPEIEIEYEASDDSESLDPLEESEDYPPLETSFDDADIDEEIILSNPDEEHIPHRLRDAVAHLEKPAISLQKRVLYSSGIVFFILLAGLQLIVFKSTAIANTLPALQSVLVSACQTLPCRYTGSHNRKQIKILNRDVRLHPKIKAALLISATIVNKAKHTQPYPTILLKFTDLTGATIAQRYFQPTEYLGLLNKPFALMPSKKPIQLTLEILDPGSDAINFQFFFL